MENIFGWLDYSRQFPIEWIYLRNMLGICMGLVGLFLGFKIRINVKMVTCLFFALLLVGVMSTQFDIAYIHNFDEVSAVYPEPIFGCGSLNLYMESLDEYENPSPSNYYNISYSSECRSGTIATIILSSLLFGGSSFIFLVFVAMFSSYVVAMKKLSIREYIRSSEQSTEQKRDSVDLTPFDVVINLLDSDYNKLLETISKYLSSSCDSEKINGIVFRNFIISVGGKSDAFKAGFNLDGRASNVTGIDYRWSTFMGLSGNCIGTASSKKIFWWTAEFRKIELKVLVDRFVIFYRKEGSDTKFLEEMEGIENPIGK